MKEAYNGTTPTKKLESDNIRKKLLKEIINFQNKLIEYYNEQDLLRAEELNELRKFIIKELRSASCFTAFKRWIVRSYRYTQDFPEVEWGENT